MDVPAVSAPACFPALYALLGSDPGPLTALAEVRNAPQSTPTPPAAALSTANALNRMEVLTPLVAHAFREASWEWIRTQSEPALRALEREVATELMLRGNAQGISVASVRIVEDCSRPLHGLFVCGWNDATAPRLVAPSERADAIGWDPSNPLDAPEHRTAWFDAMEAPVKFLLVRFIAT